MVTLPKRFPKEVADALTLKTAGIYYWPNESNMMHGKAMIIGPEGTPYAHCPLLFSLDFSRDYPFSSPAVSFLTSDGATRFHPNLYVAGKVCLSILGTWKGPLWSAAMTISTVLNSIQSLLEANPITNEPGWEKYTLENARAKDYADYVQFRLIALTICDLHRWKKGQPPHEWLEFEDVLRESGETMYENLVTIVREKAIKEDTVFSNMPYGMSGKTEWKRLLKEITSHR